MKKIATIFTLVLLLGCGGKDAQLGVSTTDQPQKLINLVNPLMGTDSDFSLSNGNTYPAIARPWGMNFWTPQTGKWATAGATCTTM